MAYILVVDDHEVIRHLLYEVLSGMGHNVTVACNGVEALNLCKEHGFDLLILDYRMPYMDGLEVAKRLNGKIHFILHTSDCDNEELKRKAQKAGALGVIEKISGVKAFRKDIEMFLKM